MPITSDCHADQVGMIAPDRRDRDQADDM